MLLQVKVLITIVVTGFLFWAYDEVGDRAVDAYKAEQAIVQAVADKAQQDKYNKLAADYEVAKADKEIVFKTIVKRVEKIVEKPIYLTVCADQEGVDAANAALEGKL